MADSGHKSVQCQNDIAGTIKKRQANFELLRLVSMLMVVALHYLSKGYVLPAFTAEMPEINQYLAYLLESFCIVAVNVFIMLSGYFLVNAQFKSGRVLQLTGQVLFYALLIPVVLFMAGGINPGDMNLYTLGNDIFPIQTEHYWFATYYIFLYLCTPLLNRGIKAMNQRQHRIMMGFLLLAFSLPKSILPIPLATDRKGYDLVWFLCVYVIGAYIRRYGLDTIKWLNNRKKCAMVYIAGALAVFALGMGMGLFTLATGKLQDQMNEVLQYNHILCAAASVGFFGVFYYTVIRDGIFSRFVCRISPYAFGVYLLHEQMDVRYLWPEWFHVREISTTIWFLPHFIVTIIGIFIGGIMIDWFRTVIFHKVGKQLRHTKGAQYLEHIDEILKI